MKSTTLLVGFCLLLTSISFAQIESKTDLRLLAEFDESPDAYHEAYLILDDQVDLEAMNLDFQKRNVSIPDRQRATLKALTDKANETQPDFIERLKKMDGVASQSITPLWLLNAIKIQAKPTTFQQLAELGNIDYISKPMELLPMEVEQSESVGPPIPNGHEIGLEVINAPPLWKMGYTGYGRTVFVFDSGIESSHPALSANFKYHNSPIDQVWNGFDEEPFTCSSHGSHVTGTILGLDRIQNDTIGAAFNSKFIHTAVFDCNQGNSDGLVAFQWSFNPDGDLTTVDDIPDAINNSWGLPASDSICSDIQIQTLIQAAIALDVALIFAAGNDGDQPMTIGTPASINNDLVHIFSVGNLDARNMQINPSSSIGPSNCVSSDSSIYIKPEVCAPGTLVRSSVLNGGYADFTGTSMACPHTVGAYLLLKEAYPTVVEAEILKALYFTATDMGPVGEDNTYGMGLIDVFAAFNYLKDLGNTPVPPVSADNDVIAVAASLSNTVLCEGQTSIEVTFENSGINPLTELDITLSETTNQFASQTVKWTGNLAPDEIGTMTIPFTGGATGKYEALVHLENPNGITDERGLNNFFKTAFNYFDETEIAADISSEFSTPVCENASVLLSANNPLDANQSYFWFENNSAVPMGEGATFVTPPLTGAANYSVDIYSNYKVGQSSNPTPDMVGSAANTGLIFDVEVPLIINSVMVDVPAAGGRIIKLFNSDGRTIATKLASFPEVGEQRIDLGFAVPPGSGYWLVLSGGGDLTFSNSGVSFPYQIDNVLSIQRSFSDMGPTTDVYNFFFDWDISAQHPCGKSEITIDVGGGMASMVDFLVDSDTILLTQAFDVLFTDISENAASWSWDFGNGETSTQQNPLTSFNEPGNYNVVLTVTDANGCVNSALKKIVVIRDDMTPTTNLDLKSQLAVFPNPAEEVLFVQLPDDLSRTDSESLIVYDVFGTKKMSFPIPSGQNFQEIQIGDLIDGTYFLMYQSNRVNTRPAAFIKN